MKIVRSIFIVMSLWLSGSDIIDAQSYCTLQIKLLTPNANVFLDNVQIQRSSLQNPIMISSGEHTIRASLNTYIPFQETYNFESGGFKTITINLEKDFRSTITISSTSPNTNVSINSQSVAWDLTSPFTTKLKPGSYMFNFSELNKISAEKELYIQNNSDYTIKVNLSYRLPREFSAYDIGREVKKPISVNDFLKPESETRAVKGDGLFLGAVGLILGMWAGSSVAKNTDSGVVAGLAIAGGGILGMSIFKAFAPTKYKTFTLQDNIDYNRGVPQMVKEKNREINEYNQRTRELIEEKENKNYSDEAVIVSQH